MRPPRLAQFAPLMLAVGLSGPTALPAQHFPEDDDLQLMLRYLVEDGETPGIVVAWVDADGSTRTLSYGSAGPDARPLGPRSVFEIGSINKTFTGVLLAIAVERGEVALEDPVEKFMPDGVSVPSRNGIEITLLDLTSHMSGLPRLPDNHVPGDMANPYIDYELDEMYEFLNTHQLRRDPGAEFEYSNIGVGVLGHALARAAGTTFVDLVRERITDPLGMDMTGYPLEGAIGEWMTQGHMNGEVVPYWFATETIQGAGGLRSNIEDMLIYLNAHLGPPESEVERAMRVAQASHRDVADGQSAGLGWGIRSTPDGPVIMHGGGTGGFSTYMVFNPELGVGAIRLTNTTGFGDDLMRDFVVRGAPYDVPEVDVDREVLASYVGTYSVGGRDVWVRLEDEGWLTYQIPGNVRFKMYAESDTAFHVKRAPYRIWFSKTEDGVDITADMGGTTRRGTRTSIETQDPRVSAGNLDRDNLSNDVMARYEGTYSVMLGDAARSLSILGRDRQLWIQLEGQGEQPLVRIGEHEFALLARADYTLIFGMEGGRSTTIALNQAGRIFRGTRTP